MLEGMTLYNYKTFETIMTGCNTLKYVLQKRYQLLKAIGPFPFSSYSGITVLGGPKPLPKLSSIPISEASQQNIFL